MPRVTKRAKQNTNYTRQEKQVLLTGVPLSPTSTRFGWPFEPFRWNIEEIRAAWEQLSDELLAEWETDDYAWHRDHHGRPFAERVLGDD